MRSHQSKLVQSRVPWFAKLFTETEQALAAKTTTKYLAWSLLYWSWQVMLEALAQTHLSETDLEAEPFDPKILEPPLKLLQDDASLVIHDALDRTFEPTKPGTERGAMSALERVLPWLRTNTDWKGIPKTLFLSRPRALSRMRHPLIERFLERYRTTGAQQAARSAIATYLEYLAHARKKIGKGVITVSWGAEHRATAIVLHGKKIPPTAEFTQTLTWDMVLASRASFVGYRRYTRRYPARTRTVKFSVVRVFHAWLFEQGYSPFDPKTAPDEESDLQVMQTWLRANQTVARKTRHMRRYYFLQFVWHIESCHQFSTDVEINNRVWNALPRKAGWEMPMFTPEEQQTVTYQILFRGDVLVPEFYLKLREKESGKVRKRDTAAAASALRRFYDECPIPGIQNPFRQEKFLAKLRRKG